MHPRFSNLVLTTAALIALTAVPAAGGPLGGTVWSAAPRPSRARAARR